MDDLNKQQKAAVKYTDSPLLVLAGAGSGKTGVITRKIAHLINQCDINPRNITAVTFTNKAAREMKSRVLHLLQDSNTRGLTICTFHSLGLNILRQELKSAKLKKGFAIFDNLDSQHLLKELTIKDELDKDTIQKACWQISTWKNLSIAPERAISEAEDGLIEFQARLYQAYQGALQTYNAVDFDDLLLRPVQIFQEFPEILEKWRNKIRYLLVDEYQDTNQTQYSLIKQLVDIRGALTVVGDDDQSIYSWRGARPENIDQLKTDFPRLNVIKLEQNYRSMGRILNTANELIKNNPHTIEKKLWSALGPGDRIRIIACKNEEHEAERIVTEIIHQKFTKGNNYGDYAILYRGNHQSRIFEKHLRTLNIPYTLSGGTSFFSRSEIKDLMAYLRLLSNPDDDSAFLRIANIPRRGLGPGTLEKLSDYANNRKITLMNAIGELGIEGTVSARALIDLRKFADWIWHLSKLAHEDHPVKTVQKLIDDMDYETWIFNNSQNDKAAEKRLENVTELIAWLDRLLKDENKGETLAEMISHLMLVDILERQDDEDKDNSRVSMMTLHAAKGLEFPHVFLIGMEENLLPHHASIEEDNIEEERRLAYVGITRAQRTLTMSYANKRRRAGETVTCEPSRFIDELPEEDLAWEGRAEDVIDPAEKKKRGKTHLANLKAMLD